MPRSNDGGSCAGIFQGIEAAESYATRPSDTAGSSKPLRPVRRYCMVEYRSQKEHKSHFLPLFLGGKRTAVNPIRLIVKVAAKLAGSRI